MKTFQAFRLAALWLGALLAIQAGSAAAQSTSMPHNLAAPYLGWSYPAAPATLETDLKFLVDPGTATSWFLSHQFELSDVNGAYASGGYIGLQTRLLGNGAKAVMFSIWNATAATPGSGATCQPFGGEGVGMQCFLAYPWEAGRNYRLRVVNERGSAYSGYIIDMSSATPAVTYIGQIQAPPGAVALGRYSVQWAEYYEQLPVNCADYPMVKALWTRPKGDGGAILAAQPNILYGQGGYCKNAAVIASGADYIMEAGNPAVGLKQHLANSQGKYLNHVATNNSCGGAGLKADGGTIQACTGITRIPLANGKVALQAENGNYLSCANGGGSTVAASARTITNYESFTETLSAGKLIYKSHSGRYLTVSSWGSLDLKCSGYFAGTTEKFTPYVKKTSSAYVSVSSESVATDQLGIKASRWPGRRLSRRLSPRMGEQWRNRRRLDPAELECRHAGQASHPVRPPQPERPDPGRHAAVQRRLQRQGRRLAQRRFAPARQLHVAQCHLGQVPGRPGDRPDRPGRNRGFLESQAHAGAGALHRQENLAQKGGQAGDKRQHRQHEQAGDEGRQLGSQECIDECAGDDHADDQAATHLAAERDVDQPQTAAQQAEFNAPEFGFVQSGQFLLGFQDADAIDNARKAIGQHANDGAHAGKQEHRRDGKLDDVGNVVNFNEGKQGKLLPESQTG